MSKPTDYILSDIYYKQLPALQYVIAELRKKVNKDSQLINKLQEQVNELTENKPNDETTDVPASSSCNCASELESIRETLRQLAENNNNNTNSSSCNCASELEAIRETLRQLTDNPPPN